LAKQTAMQNKRANKTFHNTSDTMAGQTGFWKRPVIK
jgi:hypothetical protein